MCHSSRNSDQVDRDGDGHGDACTRCRTADLKGLPQTDTDLDEVPDLCDKCVARLPGTSLYFRWGACSGGSGY